MKSVSFSAKWDDASDLSLEAGTLSPPLENLADDVKDVIKACSDTAAEVADTLPKDTKYAVSAYGHVRQGETDPSNVNLQIQEATTATTVT